MATQNRIPTLGFGASIAAVVLLGWGGAPVEQVGTPDLVIQLPADQWVVQLPSDQILVQLPSEDSRVRVPSDTYVMQAPADDRGVTL